MTPKYKPLKGPIEERARTMTSVEVAASKIEQALIELGFNPKDNYSTTDTPMRFVKYLLEFFQPTDLQKIIGEGFDAVHDQTSIHGMVVQSYIPFTSVCEHHLLPMQGEAFLGYIPHKKVIGLSKMARLVHAVGHMRPSLQEAITEQITDALFDGLDAKGAITVIKATHGCMSCRGINTPEVVTTTSCIRGLFRDVTACREEFFTLAGLR